MGKFGILLLILMFVFYPRVAHAYIDPGTGSLFFQLFFIIITAILSAFAFFYNKIIKVFSAIIGFFIKKDKEGEKSPLQKK